METLDLDGVHKNAQISDLTKTRPMGAEVFRTDGQTDVTKPTVAFRNFANAPKHILKQRHRRLVVKCAVCWFVHL